MKNHLLLHPEVAGALAEGRPVVALESTIIAHGMPFPENLETARSVEAIVRERGAVPATIAVLGGKIRVGLDQAALARLGEGRDVAKASRRDLPILVARKLDGATTVAATMIAAALAGIEVFVTGGLGGVHRGAGSSFDVSADLRELAETNVAVVCAGAKAILDLGATLEVLETNGVPVVGYRTARFPAFWVRDSGFDLDHRADSAAEIAAVVRAKRDLGLAGGVVVANPIPEEHALDPELVEQAIGDALAAATARGVTGKEVTPFLLSRVEAATDGRSLEANVALVESNAALGARLAAELAGGPSPP